MMISTLIYITLHYDCGFAISCHGKQWNGRWTVDRGLKIFIYWWALWTNKH